SQSRVPCKFVLYIHNTSRSPFDANLKVPFGGTKDRDRKSHILGIGGRDRKQGKAKARWVAFPSSWSRAPVFMLTMETDKILTSKYNKPFPVTLLPSAIGYYLGVKQGERQKQLLNEIQALDIRDHQKVQTRQPAKLIPSGACG
ncbi:hypothetical protein HII31_00934, partial [Pseudocercospora fuligena]